MTTESPCGSWPSALSAGRVTAASERIEQLAVTASGVWWSETRPLEDGRVQIVHRDDAGTLSDVLPAPRSARSRVHEYGGGSFWIFDDTVFFVDADDQRIWRVDPGADPVALTPPPHQRHGWRYADGVVTPAGRWIVCVAEVHPGEVDVPPGATEAINDLVVVPVAGGRPQLLGTGADFVSSPRVSADGRWLAWIEWDHPDMPWDSTRLMVAGLGTDAEGRPVLVDSACVAGAEGNEAIAQPEWDLDDRLWFCSDRSEWWKLHHFADAGRPAGQPLTVDHGSGDVALPPWVFGESRYAMLTDRRVVFAFSLDGVDHLAAYDSVSGRVDRLSVGATEIHQVRADGSGVVFVGASFTADPSVQAAMIGRGGATSPPSSIRPPSQPPISSSSISVGRPLSFPTADGATSHAIYYPPTNSDHRPLPGERPPLIVAIHGGPTAAAAPRFHLRTQFWTTRGFAYVDVNYRGSVGFGRRYRNELNGRWGVADVEDCLAAARHLASGGHVDPHRLLIRGSSAGGFTALSALATSDVFAAGCVLYGVSDLEALARDTHKFESRYLERLIAPYPEGREVYVERSPLARVDGLDRPVVIFQGTDDAVVPPSQSEVIVDALDRRGVPHSYVVFEGEGHGFRAAANVTRCLDAEWSFYCQVLGIPHPADVEPVVVRHR